jgi:hypothetical protein
MKYRYRSYPLASEWYNVSEIAVVWEPYIDGYFLERARIIEADRKVTLRTTIGLLW